VTIEDDALHLACVEYMKNHGYPVSFDIADQGSVQSNPVNLSRAPSEPPAGSN
jgi:hypothetical protein